MANVLAGMTHKCHASPAKHAKKKAKKHVKPKKGNRGRKLGPKAPSAMGAPVSHAKRAPVGTKPHRGKHKHGAKHPCA